MTVSAINTFVKFILVSFMRQNNALGHGVQREVKKVAWPSGLRRWFKAPVSSGAWVRIPPLPNISFFVFKCLAQMTQTLGKTIPEGRYSWPNGLGV